MTKSNNVDSCEESLRMDDEQLMKQEVQSQQFRMTIQKWEEE